MADATKSGDLEVNITDRDTQVTTKVTAAGRLLVSTETPPAGPGETAVSDEISGDISGTNDSFYTIPSGETLEIRSFSAGVENNGAGCEFTIVDDENGDLSTINTIPEGDIILDGDSTQRGITVEFLGDGTRRIRLRAEQLTGGSYRTSSSWRGVLK